MLYQAVKVYRFLFTATGETKWSNPFSESNLNKLREPNCGEIVL